MITVFGTLTKRGGHAMDRLHRDYRGLNTEDLDVLPQVPVDVDHTGVPVGQVRYVERSEQGDIRTVATVDLDDLLHLDRPVYLSGEYVTLTDSPHARAWIGTDPTLKSVALTLEPCAIGAVPVTMFPGDITSAGDRSGWPVGRLGQYPILQRCVDRYRPGGRLVLHDLTPPFTPRRDAIGRTTPSPATDTGRIPGLHYTGGGEILAVR